MTSGNLNFVESQARLRLISSVILKVGELDLVTVIFWPGSPDLIEWIRAQLNRYLKP
jgi:hypothetical protein